MNAILIDSFEGKRRVSALLDAIREEMRRAEKFFPTWPDNHIEATATVVEEAGEAIQVALNMRPHDPHCDGPRGNINALRAELIQTAAMAIRALMHLSNIEEEG